MIIGLFIGLCIGVIAAGVVYWLLNQRVKKLLSALQNSERRLQQLEDEHEIRLRAATDQLRTDYERQLVEKIEYYQDEQTLQGDLQALEFETRLQVIESAHTQELKMLKAS